jgi:hypothetical protein
MRLSIKFTTKSMVKNFGRPPLGVVVAVVVTTSGM